MTAWLVLAAGSDRQHGGNDGYDDNPSTHYSWDSTVANHLRPQPGDIIAIWDKHFLLGLSVIEAIQESEGTKPRYRCPGCTKTGFKERTVQKPKYRCPDCYLEFETPQTETILVQQFRSQHGAGWADLAGRFSADELRPLCVHPKSIQSIRELDWTRFRNRIDEECPLDRLRNATSTAEAIRGGHAKVTIRARVGQPKFRRTLIDRDGSTCVFTGPQPGPALDAAHLYSYAASGEHHSRGGLLMRADLHRLFDAGLLAIDNEGVVDVVDDLREFPDYASLHGMKAQVRLGSETKDWLLKHWQQHR